MVFAILAGSFFYVNNIHNDKEISVADREYTSNNDIGIDTLSNNYPEIPVGLKADSVKVKVEQSLDKGGKANESGLKVWDWAAIDLPRFTGDTGATFSDGELHIDSECYERQVSKLGNKIRFRVDPKQPKVGHWCSREYNMRAEIRTAPWNVRHPLGTEEWFGWSLTFSEDYVIDQFSEWLFFQVHHGVVGDSPQIELMISKEGQNNTKNAGEICVVNKGNYPDNHPTGITPKAGDELKIVVHTVWGDSSNGLLQVWINDQVVYDKKVATVYDKHPWGGNAKWGIYKWPWADKKAVDKSSEQGISHLETYMGPLKIITRKPGEPQYLSDSYLMVAPE